ncbi:MAG TPA: STAS-like domain-containing protein [Patescibacteria group bacterium]|nr:STAS-like domain-containing protein [Patescibacteria group bacterium]
MHKLLSIFREFSEFPKLRYSKLSENSAEKFYHDLLNSRFAEALQADEKLELNIDYTAGYTSSFLDEAFGNLVYDFGLDAVNENLIIISKDEPYWLDMIKNETFNEWEKRRIDNKPPIKTVSHPAWFRLVNNKLEKKVWVNV